MGCTESSLDFECSNYSDGASSSLLISEELRVGCELLIKNASARESFVVFVKSGMWEGSGRFSSTRDFPARASFDYPGDLNSLNNFREGPSGSILGGHEAASQERTAGKGISRASLAFIKLFGTSSRVGDASTKSTLIEESAFGVGAQSMRYAFNASTRSYGADNSGATRRSMSMKDSYLDIESETVFTVDQLLALLFAWLYPLYLESAFYRHWCTKNRNISSAGSNSVTSSSSMGKKKTSFSSFISVRSNASSSKVTPVQARFEALTDETSAMISTADSSLRPKNPAARSRRTSAVSSPDISQPFATHASTTRSTYPPHTLEHMFSDVATVELNDDEDGEDGVDSAIAETLREHASKNAGAAMSGWSCGDYIVCAADGSPTGRAQMSLQLPDDDVSEKQDIRFSANGANAEDSVEPPECSFNVNDICAENDPSNNSLSNSHLTEAQHSRLQGLFLATAAYFDQSEMEAILSTEGWLHTLSTILDKLPVSIAVAAAATSRSSEFVPNLTSQNSHSYHNNNYNNGNYDNSSSIHNAGSHHSSGVGVFSHSSSLDEVDGDCLSNNDPRNILRKRRGIFQRMQASLRQYRHHHRARKNKNNKRKRNSAGRTIDASRADASFPILYVNKSFERHTGYCKKQVLGRSMDILQGMSGDAELLERSLPGCEPLKMAVRTPQRKNSKVMDCYELQPVFSRLCVGKCLYVVGVRMNCGQCMDRADFEATKHAQDVVAILTRVLANEF